MAVAPDDLLWTLEAELDYPVTTATVRRRIGSMRIEAPDRADDETVAEVLAPVGDETFESAELLFEVLLGNLSDDYVGRKYYDDRGSIIEETDASVPHDERDESF